MAYEYRSTLSGSTSYTLVKHSLPQGSLIEKLDSLIRPIDSGVQSNLKTPCFRTPPEAKPHGYRYVQIQCLRSEMKKSLPSPKRPPPFSFWKFGVTGCEIPACMSRIRTNQTLSPAILRPWHLGTLAPRVSSSFPRLRKSHLLQPSDRATGSRQSNAVWRRLPAPPSTGILPAPWSVTPWAQPPSSCFCPLRAVTACLRPFRRIAFQTRHTPSSSPTFPFPSSMRAPLFPCRLSTMCDPPRMPEPGGLAPGGGCAVAGASTTSVGRW